MTLNMEIHQLHVLQHTLQSMVLEIHDNVLQPVPVASALACVVAANGAGDRGL